MALVRQASPRRADQGVEGAGGRTVKTFVLDLSAGFGVVCPMLAVFEARTAWVQWRDGLYVAHHASVPARVEAIDHQAGTRGAVPDAVVFTYRPGPEAELCRATLRLERHPYAVDDVVAVTPGPQPCIKPLIATQIGDPATTAGVAVALLLGGILSLKLWSALNRRPGWSRAAAT